MLKAFKIVMFSAALVANSAQAEQLDSNIAIKCVQRNLELLGYNPRGVDGQIGPGTSKAATEFQEYFKEKNLDTLTVENATDWCSQMLKSFHDKLYVKMQVITKNDAFIKANVRVYSGKNGIYPVIDTQIETTQNSINAGVHGLTSTVPTALLESASYICVEGISKKAVKIAIETQSSNDPHLIDGITNTNPYYRGYCRWDKNGKVLTKFSNLFSIDGKVAKFNLPISD